MLATQLTTLYEQDYHHWLLITAELLKAGKLIELDIEHLIEEIEDLGKSQRQALKSNLRILLMHLLKWHYQSELRSGSWRSTIREHRERLEDILEDSPSLKNYYLEILPQCYEKALSAAADETGLNINIFPTNCEYTPEQVLDSQFWPEVEDVQI